MPKPVKKRIKDIENKAITVADDFDDIKDLVVFIQKLMDITQIRLKTYKKQQ